MTVSELLRQLGHPGGSRELGEWQVYFKLRQEEAALAEAQRNAMRG